MSSSFPLTESNCRIIDPAEGVDLPVAPKKVQVALIALLAGDYAACLVDLYPLAAQYQRAYEERTESGW